MENSLFFLEPIAEILETCIVSAFIEGEIPVSVILVGPSGSAKSKLLKRYNANFIHHTDSITSNGLATLIQSDPKNELKIIIIPDLNPTLSRRAATSSPTVANMLSVSGDGTVRIDDGRPDKDKGWSHKPIAFLTACTPEIYDKNAKEWFALGLRRRIIPIFYDYTTETNNALQKLVREDKIHSEMLPPVNVPIPQKPMRLKIEGEDAIALERSSDKFATNLGKLFFYADGIKKWTVKTVVPLSPHVTLRTLAMAHAIRARRLKITQDDMKFIASFVDFTDYAAAKKI